MGALASYFPSMEEELQDPEDFLGAGSLVESRVASERADNDVQELTEIRASLEALAASMEADLEADPFTPVFINHALDAVGRRTGLKLPTASLEDTSTTISMEGLGGALKAIWDAIVKAVKAAIAAVANFFRRLYELVTGKKRKIEANFEKAKKAGDATPSKLADTNNLSKIADKEIEALKEKLKKPELVKCRKDQLVALTSAAATIVDRANILEGNQTIVKEEITHKGEQITLVRREDVKKAKYLKVCQASNDFISHASVAGLHLIALKDQRCEIDIHDLTELIWECLYRGKEAREAGKAIAASVLEITDNTIAVLKSYYEKGSKLYSGDFQMSDVSDQLHEQLMKQFDPVFKEFARFESQSGLIPAGRRVNKLKKGGLFNLFDTQSHAPLLAKFTENDVVMKIPTWAESKKASDGVTSLMILNTQKSVTDGITKSFDAALSKWSDAIKWVYEQGHGDSTVHAANMISDYCKIILTNTQDNFNRYLRSQMTLEGSIVLLSDVLSGSMARLADSKAVIEELA